MPVCLQLIVVGAGLGGLAAAISSALSGHKVLILEAARQLSEVGAGLQITPNASRLLFEWGLREQVEAAGCEPLLLAVHRYSDGRILAQEDAFNVQMRTKYNAPFIDMHRGDLQQMLYKKALELGVEVRTSARVSNIDVSKATVTLESGEELSGDLIVGADGLWSRCREVLLGRKDSPLPTGDVAYRIVLNLEEIDEPELKQWVSKPACHFWIGPSAHAVAYSMRGGSMYNIVLLVPDDLPQDVSRQAGSIEEMKKLFVGWDPVLTRFINQVSSVDKWKLMHRPELERWTTTLGTLALLGDSCHPMLPYLAQGANSAIEDGAVLGGVLKGLQSKAELPRAIKAWENLRKKRSEAIARETFHQRAAFHMVDGPEQEKRDKLFESQLGKEVDVKFPSRWTCAEVQPWLYGYNASQEADAARADLRRKRSVH